MFCDSCGDLTVVSVPLVVTYPDGEKITINLCLDCKKGMEKSRKHLVAEMLRILMEDEK